MTKINPPDPGLYEDIIATALDEDLAYGDITTDNLDLPNGSVEAELIAKEKGILAGLDVFIRVYFMLDENITHENFSRNFNDGDEFKPGDTILNFSLSPSVLLKGERTSLNLLCHLSGIATYTRMLVDLVAHSETRISDTRKTLPGLRVLQKYAVRVGGGVNHRFALYDAVLIKNNHIALAGDITTAVNQIRQSTGHIVKIEVETSDLDDVKEALDAGVDIIMLDNFTPDKALKAVEMISKRAIVEISGGIDSSNIRDFAGIGADIISIGALTHSVKAIDMSVHVVK